MIIFLDFDGVLHHIRAHEHEGFQHVPALENVLLDFLSVQIVISSSWRYFESLEQLKEHFSPDIAERIIDVTPTLEPTWQQYARFKEISAWISENNYKGDWLAIDDQYGEFPKVGEGLDIQECDFEIKDAWHPNLVWSRKQFGLRAKDLDYLRLRLSLNA